MFNPKWTIDTTRPFIEKTIEIFGVERCMFASNYPVDKKDGCSPERLVNAW